jgi:N-methylhydantoinase B
VTATKVDIDPITYEVLHNAFSAVVNEMSISIEKSAYSLVITEGKDFSSALYTADGRLIAQGDQDLPGQIGAMQFAMQSTIEYLGADAFAPGDVVITNDPTLTGTHLQDVKMLSPVFHRGELIAFVGTTGHWPDIGGAAAGGFSASATEVYQEGVRIRPVKLYKDGKADTELLTLILDNIRIPDERLGDLRAQAGACHIGASRLGELCDKYGTGLLLAAMERSIEYAEQLLRSELRALPDGEWSFEDHLDTNGLERIPVTIRVTVRINGDTMEVDFTGTSPTAPGPVNIPYFGAQTAVFVGLKSLYPEIPSNAGVFRPISFVAPDDTIITPRHPAPVSGNDTYLRTLDAFMGAMAEVLPERSIGAMYGSFNNLVLAGHDPLRDRPFLLYVWGEGGWGGRMTKDGVSAAMHLIAAGTTNQPSEALEHRFPLLVETYALRPDSGGPGRYRGGLGIVREMRLLADGVTAIGSGDRQDFRPYGILGGGPAAGSEWAIQREGEEQHDLPPRFEKLVLADQDVLRYASPGGGGYGPVSDRDPEAVRRDVADGYVTTEGSQRDYGVDPGTR